MKDRITIAWNIEDVLSMNLDLTTEQAQRVLKLAKDNYDANIGINWGVLQDWIDYVLEEEE